MRSFARVHSGTVPYRTLYMYGASPSSRGIDRPHCVQYSTLLVEHILHSQAARGNSGARRAHCLRHRLRHCLPLRFVCRDATRARPRCCTCRTYCTVLYQRYSTHMSARPAPCVLAAGSCPAHCIATLCPGRRALARHGNGICVPRLDMSRRHGMGFPVAIRYAAYAYGVFVCTVDTLLLQGETGDC